ncbi:MAG: glycosyltransferase [Endomicrobia bacterium]|nr:glycosyltransferase [Endomicrobiia bacterium]
MTSPKISILIPCYNSSKYIRQCVESVLNQTFKDIELICVNDGSTDNTLEILNEYAAKAKDSRLKVFTQANSGVAATLNAAIGYASGDYIFIMGHDDFLDLNYFEVLYARTLKDDYDMVLGGISVYYEDCSVKKLNLARDIDIKSGELVEINDGNRDKFFALFYKRLVIDWGRLVKRAIIADNNIKKYDQPSSDDMPFTALTFLYVKKIILVDSVNYYYRKFFASLSEKTALTVLSCINNFTTLKKEVFDRGFKDKKYEDIIDRAVCDILIGYYDRWNTGLFSRCSVSEIRKMYPLAKERIEYFNTASVVKNSSDKFLKIKWTMFRFGIKHNIYIMPKIIRLVRNIVRIFWFFE